MNYFILGSCVTRDIFRIVGQDTVVDYYARTTLKSLISKPVFINDISLESEFQKRIVKRDFAKTFFLDIANTEFDYLIIDLIDERFDTLKIGDSFIAKSNECANAGLGNTGTKLDLSLDEWTSNCEIFSNRLLDILPVNKIIIHEAYWAKEYIDNGDIKQFENQSVIDSNNEILQDYYDILKYYIPASTVTTNNRIGSKQHTWGLSPFHYTDDYYKNIYIQINGIPNKRSEKIMVNEAQFKDAPITQEADGMYQFIVISGITYYRNVDSGEISYRINGAWCYQ